MNKQQIRLHRMIDRTKALGPGERCVVWFQGCFRTCIGCMSISSRNEAGGSSVFIEDITTKIKSIKGIEGITISGGEPFMQIEGLHLLVKRLKTETNLGIILYSGYYLNELHDMNNKEVEETLYMIDILVDGLYIDELNDGVGLRGSSNQTVHFLTERYKPYKELYTKPSRNVEMHMIGSEISIVGVPDIATLKTFDNLSLNIKKPEKEDYNL